MYSTINSIMGKYIAAQYLRSFECNNFMVPKIKTNVKFKLARSQKLLAEPWESSAQYLICHIIGINYTL